MRLPRSQDQSGIALIMVMFIVVVFAMMAAGLAYTMKVETKLARNSNWDTELEWMGRSGIELAKYFISKSGQQGVHALNQRWAGGTGETNEALDGLSLTDNQIGRGTVSIKIIDCDRKFNVNMASRMPDIMNQAFILMGIDATEAPHLTAAIQDWIDRDDQVTAGGQDTESSFYESLKPPYRAKNGPIDDLTEMLMIKGVTPAMFYGNGSGAADYRGPRVMRSGNARNPAEEISYPIGFVDLFTTVSGQRININTASPTVMQLIPDVDGNMAQAIVQLRAGPDGVEGNEDDMPFRSAGELANVPGMTQGMATMFNQVFSTRSTTFEVQVEAQIDQYKRTYHALVRPMNANQIVTLYMWWN